MNSMQTITEISLVNSLLQHYGFAVVVSLILLVMGWKLVRYFIVSSEKVAKENRDALDKMHKEHREERIMILKEHKAERDDCYKNHERMMTTLNDSMKGVMNELSHLRKTG